MAKKKYKYSKKKDGCCSSVIVFCGVSLQIISDIQAKSKIKDGRTISIQRAFNYAMNDYFNLRNK